MPTILSHAVVASVIGKVGRPTFTDRRFWRTVLFCSIVPDADVLAFRFGIPYEHWLGHRGFSHSILFALVLALLMVVLFFRKYGGRLRLFLLFFLATVSHGILDAFTDGGLGVGFFIPFSDERFFAPWTPIQVSLIGRRFFSSAGLEVLSSEVIWIWLPSFVILGVVVLFKKFKSKVVV